MPFYELELERTVSHSHILFFNMYIVIAYDYISSKLFISHIIKKFVNFC